MATQKLQAGRALYVTFYSDTVNIPYPEVVVQGGTVSTTDLTILEDNNVDFQTNGVEPGDIIWNLSSGDSCSVVGVNGSSRLLTDSLLGFSAGDVYWIYKNSNEGCVLFSGSGGNLEVETVGGDIVTFTNVPAGTFVPVQVLKVRKLTSATDVIALW